MESKLAAVRCGNFTLLRTLAAVIVICYFVPAKGCGGSWTSFSGKFTSPGYPSYYHSGSTCTYRIHSPQPGKKIQIKFDFTYISYADTLQVKNSSGATVASLVGKVGYRTAQASTSYVATLSRNSPFVHYGFSATWVACGGLWTTDTGSVSSPYYPAHYHNLAECTYTIAPASGKTVALKVDDFITESKDTVEIRDASGKVLDTLSGSVGDKSFGPSSSFVIAFKADHETNEKGFQMSWALCGGDFTTDTGSLSSSFHPNNYHNQAGCTYTVTPSSGNYIQLEVEDFNTAQNDKLEVRLGSGKVLATLSGSVTATVFGPASSFVLQFTSDSETTNTGFRLSWKVSVKQLNVITFLHLSPARCVHRKYRLRSSSGLSGLSTTITPSSSRDECLYLCDVTTACTHLAYSDGICTILQPGHTAQPLPPQLYWKS